MNCHEARELCSVLIDDALPADEHAALQAHLDGCAECRRELDRLRQTIALLGGLAPARAPVGFVDRVLTAAHPEPWYRRALRAVSLPFRVRLPLEAAALLIVGGLAVYVFQHSPELQRAIRTETLSGAPVPGSVPAQPHTLSGESARTSASTGPASAPGPSTSGSAPSASAPTFTSGSPQSVTAPPPGHPDPQRAGPTTSVPGSSEAPPVAASGKSAVASPAPSPARDREIPASGGTPPSPASPAPTAPAQQPPSGAGAKDSPLESARRTAEARQGAAGEVAKTGKADAKEEDRRNAAQAPGGREQKKSDTRADEPRVPPTAESPPLPGRDEQAASELARRKSAEPALRSRQEIAAGSAPAPQGAVHVAADVSASDRDTALRGLADLVARAQGRELARRSEADGTVVVLLIPRAGYAEFAQGLGRLGQVAMPLQAASLPEEVRVSVRVRP